MVGPDTTPLPLDFVAVGSSLWFRERRLRRPHLSAQCTDISSCELLDSIIVFPLSHGSISDLSTHGTLLSLFCQSYTGTVSSERNVGSIWAPLYADRRAAKLRLGSTGYYIPVSSSNPAPARHRPRCAVFSLGAGFWSRVYWTSREAWHLRCFTVGAGPVFSLLSSCVWRKPKPSIPALRIRAGCGYVRVAPIEVCSIVTVEK
jgi:hypothetical protein